MGRVMGLTKACFPGFSDHQHLSFPPSLSICHCKHDLCMETDSCKPFAVIVAMRKTSWIDQTTSLSRLFLVKKRAVLLTVCDLLRLPASIMMTCSKLAHDRLNLEVD